MKRIYVASSWRNSYQPSIVQLLRDAGHEVYDFRNPAPGNNGFGWSQIDPRWQEWTPSAFRGALQHPVARKGFGHDYEAMAWAEEFCLVLPCGRSAHLEAGWAAGSRRRLSIYMPEQVEPELMYLTGGDRTRICLTADELRRFHAEGVS